MILPTIFSSLGVLTTVGGEGGGGNTVMAVNYNGRRRGKVGVKAKIGGGVVGNCAGNVIQELVRQAWAGTNSQQNGGKRRQAVVWTTSLVGMAELNRQQPPSFAQSPNRNKCHTPRINGRVSRVMAQPTPPTACVGMYCINVGIPSMKVQ